MFKKTAVVSLVIILCLINGSIIGKEKHLAQGKIVYLRLAPVDPRSLMQGDYMALRFQVANDVYKTLPRSRDPEQRRDVAAPGDGYAVIGLDERRRGSFKGLYDDQILSAEEMIMRYRVRKDTVRFATNAYFFQEGHGKFYEKAVYGQFRVDSKGELLLVSLHDKDLNKLGPVPQK